MDLERMIGYGRRFHALMAEYLARKRASRSSPSAMISFTFDDFPRSALTVGGKMLTDHGWKGTYYGSMGLMGSGNGEFPIFTRDDLDDAMIAGHELACHTLHHTSCLSVDTGTFAESCAENRRWAAALLGGYRLRNLSFPYGHVTLAAKYRVRSAYDTCRSIQWGINSDPVDLGFLRANPIYSRYSVDMVRGLIRANSRANGWLVLYTHDVADDPTPFGCTPGYFEEVLRSVHESGSEVLTISEAVSRFRMDDRGRDGPQSGVE